MPTWRDVENPRYNPENKSNISYDTFSWRITDITPPARPVTVDQTHEPLSPRKWQQLSGAKQKQQYLVVRNGEGKAGFQLPSTS